MVGRLPGPSFGSINNKYDAISNVVFPPHLILLDDFNGCFERVQSALELKSPRVASKGIHIYPMQQKFPSGQQVIDNSFVCDVRCYSCVKYRD